MEGQRNHEFTGIDLGAEPTVDDLWALIQRLDGDNEAQRLRLLEVFDWLETAVDEQVRAERVATQCRAETQAAYDALTEAQRSAEDFQARLIASQAELHRLTDSPVRRLLVKAGRLLPSRLARRG